MRTLDRLKSDARVADVWSETAMGDGYWISLKPGFADGSNPGCHTLHEQTVGELAKQMQHVKPCNCADCKKAAITTVRLTKTEAEILQHRLEVPDAIADGLIDNDDGDKWKDAPICERCEIMHESAKSGTIEIADDLDKAIIFDCMDGSTFMGNVDDMVGVEITHQRASSWHRAMESLADKIAAVCGERPNVPHC